MMIQEKYDTEDLREFLSNIDYYLDRSEIVKDDRNVKIGICEFRKMRIFVKRYNDRGFLHRTKYLLRRMRALNSILAYDNLIRNVAELLVPEHIAAIWKKGIFASSSYLLAEAMKDGLSLHYVIQRLKFDEQRMRMLIRCIVEVLVKLHGAGVYHGDAKLSNFCYLERGGEVSCGVWDLDNMRVYSCLPVRLRCYDVGNAVGSFYKLFREELSLEEIAQNFCNEYMKIGGGIISVGKVLKEAKHFLR